MWRLKLEDGDNQEGLDGNQNLYPDRPGAPDCRYYLRTRLCGYGSNYRYNHPTYNEQENQDRGKLPERFRQPDCQMEFYQGGKSQRNLKVVVAGNRVPLYGGGASLTNVQGKTNLTIPLVPLNVAFTVRARAYVLGKLVKPKF